MSTKQLSNKKQNQFVIRESAHNIISATFFIFASIITILLIIFSSLLGSLFVLIPSLLFLVFFILKVAIQIRSIILFNKLTKIDDEAIYFYTTKSWNRKREGTIWMGIISIITLTIPLIISLSLLSTTILFDVLSLFISILFVIIVCYLNIQTLEGNIKLSEKKLNLNSMEWKQIKKETKIFYRLIFVYYLSLLLIIPLFLLIIPVYRNKIYNIVKN